MSKVAASAACAAVGLIGGIALGSLVDPSAIHRGALIGGLIGAIAGILAARRMAE